MDERTKQDAPSRLQKTPWWVLLVPSLVSFIIVTLIALLFLTR